MNKFIYSIFSEKCFNKNIVYILFCKQKKYIETCLIIIKYNEINFDILSLIKIENLIKFNNFKDKIKTNYKTLKENTYKTQYIINPEELSYPILDSQKKEIKNKVYNTLLLLLNNIKKSYDILFHKIDVINKTKKNFFNMSLFVFSKILNIYRIYTCMVIEMAFYNNEMLKKMDLNIIDINEQINDYICNENNNALIYQLNCIFLNLLDFVYYTTKNINTSNLQNFLKENYIEKFNDCIFHITKYKRKKKETIIYIKTLFLFLFL